MIWVGWSTCSNTAGGDTILGANLFVRPSMLAVDVIIHSLCSVATPVATKLPS